MSMNHVLHTRQLMGPRWQFSGMWMTWRCLIRMNLGSLDLYGILQYSCGKVHDYLGMTLEYSEKGKLQFSIIPYLINLLKEIPEELGSLAATPAPDNMFKVRPEGEARFLSWYQAQIIHHNVEQLMFLSARLPRGIQTALAFLTTKTKQPDKEYWFKFRQCLK